MGLLGYECAYTVRFLKKKKRKKERKKMGGGGERDLPNLTRFFFYFSQRYSPQICMYFRSLQIDWYLERICCRRDEGGERDFGF